MIPCAEVLTFLPAVRMCPNEATEPVGVDWYCQEHRDSKQAALSRFARTDAGITRLTVAAETALEIANAAEDTAVQARADAEKAWRAARRAWGALNSAKSRRDRTPQDKTA